jgi:hypothetical protein
VSQLGQQALEPAGVAGGLDAHADPALQSCVESARFSIGVFQTALAQLARLRIQHRNLLVARV